MSQKIIAIALFLVVLGVGIYSIFLIEFGIALGGCGDLVSNYFCDVVDEIIPIIGAILIAIIGYFILSHAFSRKMAVWVGIILFASAILFVGFPILREYQQEKGILEAQARKIKLARSAETITDCADPYYRDACLMILGIRTKDLKICDAISNTSGRGPCYQWVDQAIAGTISNKSCDSIIVDPEQDKIIASSKGTYFTQEYSKQRCYYDLGIYFKDKSMCTKAEGLRVYPSCDSLIHEPEGEVTFMCWLRTSCVRRYMGVTD